MLLSLLCGQSLRESYLGLISSFGGLPHLLKIKVVLSTRSLFVSPMLNGWLPGSPDCALKERLVELEWDETGVGCGG